MKEIFYEMAEQLATGILPTEEAKTWVESLGQNEEVWQEIVVEIPFKAQEKPSIVYSLSCLLMSWAELTLSSKEVHEAKFWQGWGALLSEDFTSAHDFFSISQSYAAENNDQESLYRYYKYYGDGYLHAGRAQQAQDFYRQSLTIGQNMNSPLKTAQALKNLAWLNQSLVKKNEAIELYLKSFATVADSHPEYASQVAYDLLALYEKEDNSSIVLDGYKKTIALFQKVGDKKGEAITLSKESVQLVSEGKKEEALTKLNHSLRIIQKANEKKSEVKIQSLLGDLYKDIGQFSEAIRCYEEARKLMRIIDQENIETPSRTREEPVRPAPVATPLAAPPSASTLPDDGEEFVDSIEEEEDILPESLEQKKKEITSFLKVLQSAREKKNTVREYKTLYVLGMSYAQVERNEDAIESWQDAIPLASEMEDWLTLFRLNFQIGSTYLKNDEYEEARHFLLAGIKILEEYRYYFPPQDLEFQKEHYLIFSQIISCCVKMGNPAQSLHFAEQAQYWKFFGRLEEKHLLQRCNANPEEKKEYLAALKRLHRFYKLVREELDQNIDKESFLSMRKTLRDDKEKVDQFRMQLEVLDPGWSSTFGYEFRFDPITVQNALSEATVLLEFIVTGQETIVFLVDRRKIDVICFENLNISYLQKLYRPLFQIEHFLRCYREQKAIAEDPSQVQRKQQLAKELDKYTWKTPAEAYKNWQEKFNKINYGISQKLFPELLVRLEDRCADNLVFVMQGLWELCPIHALPMIEEGEDEIFLQDYYEIIYAPSARMFLESSLRPKTEDGQLLLATYQPTGSHLSDELHFIEKSWPDKVDKIEPDQILWEKVSEEISDYNYTHLAIENTIVFPDALQSSIFLPSEEAEYLTLPSIMENLKLFQTEVITLSGGHRKVYALENGGEFTGFAQAFLNCGAKNFIQAMWPLPRIALLLLWSKFYEGIGQGLGIAMALQEAQNVLRAITVAEIIEQLQQIDNLTELDSWWDEALESLIARDSSRATRILYTSPYLPVVQDVSFLAPEMSPLDEFQPYKSPCYWGALFCFGAGLTEVSDKASDPLEADSVVYIEELNMEGEVGTQEFQNVEEALSSLTDEAIKKYDEPAKKSAKEEDKIDLDEVKKNAQVSKIIAKTRCPECGNKIRCILPKTGGKARCPHCQKKIRVRGQSTPYDNVKISSICPKCAENINCFLPMAGKKARCPRCEAKLRIPKRDILLAEIAAGDPNSSVLLLNG